MPLKFYLTNTNASYTPATIRGAWESSGSAVTKAIRPYKEDGGALTTVQVIENDASPTYDVLLYRGVSYPLASQAFGGTIDIAIGLLEEAVSNDLYAHVYAYFTSGENDVVSSVLLNDYVENTPNEFTTLANAVSGVRPFVTSQTVLSTGINEGDRLVVEIGYIARNTFASFVAGYLYYGTKSAASSGVLEDAITPSGNPTITAGYVEFSQELYELTSDIKIRDSHLLSKSLQSNTPNIRDSNVSNKVLLANTRAIRDSKIIGKVLGANTRAIRDSQTLLKVLLKTTYPTTTTFSPFWVRNSNIVISPFDPK